ncbi:MAG: hypothetical protein ACYTGQ_15385 [Planctomycetota bacterium]|jgi:hypothetical protein
MAVDETVLAKLEELLEAIRGYDDPRRASSEWKQAFNQLKKTDVDAGHVANVVAGRQLAGLTEIIEELKEVGAETVVEAPEGDRPDDVTCKMAMRAFKKRLKLTRLDDESQLNSRNPLSGGASSGVRSILPPSDWGPEVWAELARQGKLRHTGKGFYELTGN